MRPLSNWKVNPQPSTGPSAGRVSPDPESHHPELGTARQHAERQAMENAPAILIPADTPSPRPGSDSPAPLQFLHGGHGAHQGPQASPFDHSVPLQPLDRGQSNTGMEPHFAPLRPYSPSEAYLPGFNADPHAENIHREMVNHNFATFMHHPQAPMAPAGRYVLEPSIADALLQFRSQVRAMPDPYQEYAQTYRMVDGNRMEPVRPQPITGFMNEVRLPEGSFPPGTGLVIHSHPPRRDGIQVPGRPSEADMLRAYQDRTNALQDPRSNVTSHILYDHGTDNAFIYDGRLGPDGNPRYYQAVLPPSHQAPNQAVMQAHVSPQLPIAAPVPRHPVQAEDLLPQMPSREASPAHHFPNPQDQAFRVPGITPQGTPRPPSVNQTAGLPPIGSQAGAPRTPEGFDMSQWIHSNPPSRPGSANIEGWDKGWNDFIDLNPKTPPA